MIKRSFDIIDKGNDRMIHHTILILHILKYYIKYILESIVVVDKFQEICYYFLRQN
jgi:hypothetical protein